MDTDVLSWFVFLGSRPGRRRPPAVVSPDWTYLWRGGAAGSVGRLRPVDPGVKDRNRPRRRQRRYRLLNHPSNYRGNRASIIQGQQTERRSAGREVTDERRDNKERSERGWIRRLIGGENPDWCFSLFKHQPSESRLYDAGAISYREQLLIGPRRRFSSETQMVLGPSLHNPPYRFGEVQGAIWEFCQLRLLPQKPFGCPGGSVKLFLSLLLRGAYCCAGGRVQFFKN